jgi:hypothetical protein
MAEFTTKAPRRVFERIKSEPADEVGARFKMVIGFAICTKSVRLQSPALAASNRRLAAWIAARFCLAQWPRRLTGSSKECPGFGSS